MEDLDALIFDEHDKGVFAIPDVKTRLDTLQNYFFPRLKRLAVVGLEMIREIYQLDPYEHYSFIYRPAHRKDAKANIDMGEVYVGIAAKRVQGKGLVITKPNGSSYSYHPGALCIKVMQSGGLFIELEPFRYFDDAYIKNVNACFAQNRIELELLLSLSRGVLASTIAGGLSEVLAKETRFSIPSPVFYFPVKHTEAIYTLILTFAALFPILEAIREIAEGRTPTLAKLTQQLKDWLDKDYQVEPEVAETTGQPFIPDLDSYRFVRDRMWFQILARDQWTCRSCGRSSRTDGIVLHVDHIVPRSLGGKDEVDNLQTLCMKCNLGKSNLDTTDLRSPVLK